MEIDPESTAVVLARRARNLAEEFFYRPRANEAERLPDIADFRDAFLLVLRESEKEGQ